MQNPLISNDYCRTFDNFEYKSDATMNRKVYFAGSIRGGREDAELYRRIIGYIQRTDVVLTEHIGRPDIFESEKGALDTDIYEQDTAWIRECDVLIGECTHASLGVGYELAYAESHGKPVHVFYNSSRTVLSAMLAGNRRFHVHPYSDESEIYPLIDRILSDA